MSFRRWVLTSHNKSSLRSHRFLSTTNVLLSTVSTSTPATPTVEPPPAGGHSPSVATSVFLRQSRESALKTPGLTWTDEWNEEVGNRETRKMNMYQAIRDALSIALSKDDTAVVFGEDVNFGGVFRCTMGLAEEFGPSKGRERVFNTPLTEQGIVGFGIGLASMGHTAIAEIQFADYIFPAFDQLVNEAAKFRYRSGGQFNCGSMTVRTPTMAVGHGGLYHSQSPEGFFMGASGLKIVIPRSPIQAKGLLLASIRDPNPVIFMEPKVLYRSAVEQVPVDDYMLPLGKAEVLQKGDDLTVVTFGTPVYHCETALSMLRDPPEGIAMHVPSSVRGANVELIDLRSILPWDVETVAESVNKTGRVVFVHEAGRTMGVASEMCAEIQKRCFLKLEAPLKRITGWDVPHALQFEKMHLPDSIRIVDGIPGIIEYRMRHIIAPPPMQDYQAPLDSDNAPPKPVASRGARACTVCRAAKMKCVGAEDDGAKPCQRCRRSNSECIFEKHRRGRKPGSKLSEASKLLRKIEKSSATPAKIKSMSDVPSMVPSQSSPSPSLPLPPPPPPPLPLSLPPPSPSPPQSFSGVPSSTRYSTLQSSSPPAPPRPSSVPPISPQIQPASVAPPPFPPPAQQQPSTQDTMEEEEDDEKDEETMYPAKMVERAGRRHNFFGTVLTNPIPKPSSTPVVPSSSSPDPSSYSSSVLKEHRHRPHGLSSTSPSSRNVRPSSPGASSSSHQHPSWSALSSIPPTNIAAILRYLPFISSRFLQNPVPIPDPVRADILSSDEVSSLFEMIFLRLNPFVNLFDPALHTPEYVREACPFLFTVLCMAGCKFFKPEKFRAVQRMAEDLCLRAFQECWKRVEVVQAFMCMTYWREPDDQRTWTFIGYAARMAIELGLNTYCYPTSAPLPGETTDMHRLQRRNRERTYLVLWVHDRSLSMQTGRHWMLPEDDLVRNAARWYRESTLLPIDTVVAAQIELRRIAASVIDAFYLHRARNGDTVSADVNYDVLLGACNSRLQLWNDDWMTALQKTNGAHFHASFLTFFKLHVCLFLNSLGLQTSLLVHHSHHSSSPEVHAPIPNLFALNTCYSSAADTLKLVARDFSKVEMLRYGQDSITVMTAYSAVFLLKLLRNVVQASSLSLGDNSLERVYELINATADAYQACAKSISENNGTENGGHYLPVDSSSGENMETDIPSLAGGAATLNYINTKNGESASNPNENYTNSTGAKLSNVGATTPVSTMIFSSVEYHGRFLRTLVLKDKASRTRAAEREKRRTTGASFNGGSNKTSHSPSYGAVSRISTSGLPNLALSSDSNTLAVSPTTSAAATALLGGLGGSFSGTNTKGPNGLANAAASSALTNGSAPSSRNTGEIIVPSSSSTTSGSGSGTPTGNLYHVSAPSSSSLTGGNPSPYIVSSSSTSHHNQRSQQLMSSHSHHVATQPSNAQHIPTSHNGISGLANMHRASFSHVQTPQHPGSSRSQSHLQRVNEQGPVQHSGSMQQNYNQTIPNHSIPTWHFPASSHLPAHPLISPEDEYGPLEPDTVGNTTSGPAGIPSSGMYNQPLGPMNNSTDTTTGHVMNNISEDDGASPHVGGDGCNGDESTNTTSIEGLPPGASVGDVAYWYYMHSEMGYGNGGINPLASVGAGTGNHGGFVGVTGPSIGSYMMGTMSGGGIGLTNINSGIGNSGISTGMSAMNTVPGLAVPNVSHTGLSGIGGILAAGTGNNNASDSGGTAVKGIERVGIGASHSSSSGVNPKRRTSSTNAPAGYQQHTIHHTHSQNHTSSHHVGHGHSHSSTTHSMPSPYHSHGQSHGHHVMQSG